MRSVLFGLAVLLFSEFANGAQELSTFVYPSEDELEQAFYNGEIDLVQLLILQEIIRFGIDSTESYLLDEIPNLSFFLEIKQTKETELEKEQESAFLAEEPISKKVTGKLIYGYSRILEAEGHNRYRTSGKIILGESMQTAFRLHKEYSGNERFVYRNFDYRPKNSFLRRMTVGNFTTRLGLGTIIGYRGKILDYSGEINGESILFPDYGGYNGIDLKMKRKSIESEIIFSHNRDAVHSISTFGSTIGSTNKKLSPGLIAALTRLKERSTGEFIDDIKYGVNFRTRYESGYNRLEVSMQAGEKNSFGAVVSEGRHIFKKADIGYSFWHYGNEYLDITGGSKAASIRETIDLPDINFNYSDKRNGQTGGLVKTIVKPAENIELINSVIYAEKANKTYNFEFLSALVKKFNANWQLRLDHLSRIRNRSLSMTGSDNTFRRSRAELRFINSEVFVRTYIAYQSETDEDDYTSLFFNLRYNSREYGRTSLWLNIGEFDQSDGEINYWYGYIENKQELFQNVHTLAKISHSYRRGSTNEHSSTVSIGLEVTI